MTDTRIHFTKATVEGVALPAKGSRFYWDDKTPGLAVRVTAGGARTFYVYRKVSGKPEQMRIGPFPALTVEQARKKAAELNGKIAQGEDVAGDRREERSAQTFAELFEWYLAQPKKNGTRAPKTEVEYRKQFRLYLGGIANRKPGQVSGREIETLIAKVGRENGPYAANRTLALVRAVFNRAIRKGLVKGINPAITVESFAEKTRDRRLAGDEAARFLAAVAEEPNETIRDYVLLSLYTGARKANVLAMRWDEVDFTARTWRIPVTKNGTSQTVPLEDAEVELLARRRLAAAAACPWVFPSTGASGHLADPKAGWARILERAGIANLRIHDLRRSLASFMVDSGASLPVVGMALNHQSQATTAIYARLSLDPVREAKRAAHGAMHAATVASPPQLSIVPAAAGPVASRPKRVKGA